MAETRHVRAMGTSEGNESELARSNCTGTMTCSTISPLRQATHDAKKGRRKDIFIRKKDKDFLVRSRGLVMMWDTESHADLI